MQLKLLLLLALCIICFTQSIAQCPTGSEPQCMCTTAPVLCTIDELDGFMFSMSSFQHPNDGPSPLCPGANNSVTNNPTWFAFQAWCTNLTLNVMLDNCVGVGGSNGVQIAIYSNCTTYTPVACNVAVTDCGNTNDKTLVMNNLQIGNTYYFLVDGCAGSYCDITVDVVGVCGEAMIDDWTQPLMGETNVCAGDTETYTVEDVDGANTFHWFIDGAEVMQTTGPTHNITWNTPGTYELCTDVSSAPCIPVTDPPEPVCETITVYGPEAGEIAVNPNPLCPDEVSTLTATGFNMDPGVTQVILVVNASGIIVQVTPGGNATFTHDECANFTVYSYNFMSADGTPMPTVGQNINSINCGQGCCELDSEPLSFEDLEPPVFVNPPPNITVSCLGELPPGMPLTWNDNCDGTGQAIPADQNIPTACTGGTMQRIWMHEDECGNLATHTQQIVVQVPPVAAFVNPPADVTVNCDNIPASAPALNYTNNAPGSCLIMGSVSPVMSGNGNLCGGSISFTWTFTDMCNRTITHEQNVTITPPATVAFVNPPPDITVNCDNIPASAPALMYTNNGPGACLIAGMVSPTLSGTGNVCGGDLAYTWTFTDVCNRTITHVQNITITPATPPAFVNPPADMTVNCDNVPSSAPALAYTNNGPGACLIAGMVPAVQSGTGNACGGTITYTWTFTDQCNRTITHVQNISITPPTFPAFVNPPADITVSCENIPTSAPSLTFTNNGTGACLIQGMVPAIQNGTPTSCGMDFSYTWMFTDQCGNTITHTQNIIVDPTPEAAFTSTPGDITVSCAHDPATYQVSLSYTNGLMGNCNISGSVPAVITGSFDECGGTLVSTWSFTDACGRMIQHQRNIVVDPAPQAMFANPPPDVTVSCANVGTLTSNLSYSNGQGGACAIAGTAVATQVGSYNSCGGNIQFVWSFTDDCGRTINHTRNVSVTPAPSPAFVNPPGNTTIECAAIPATPPSLSYTNGGSGLCTIAGSVIAIQSGSYDACGGNISYTWSFTDACGNTISHVQNLVVSPSPDPVFIDPPEDMQLDCQGSILPPEDLFYSNGLGGNCAISGSVSPTVEFITNGNIYTWEFVNPCNNNFIIHSQTVTVDPTPDIILNPQEVVACQGLPFDLSTISVTDVNGTNPVITYHAGSPAGPGNQLPSSIVSPQNSTTYYILATNGFDCTDEAEFDIVVDIPPDAGGSSNWFLCNEDLPISLFDYLGGNPSFDGEWTDLNFTDVNIDNPFNVNFYNQPAGIYTFQYVVFTDNTCPNDTAILELELLSVLDANVQSVECSGDGSTYTVTVNTNGWDVGYSAGTGTDLGGGILEISSIPISTGLTLTITEPVLGCAEVISLNPPDCNCPPVAPPVNNGNQQICEGQPTPALSVTVQAGQTANWYADAAGTNLLASMTLTFTPSVTAPGTYTYYTEAEDLTDNCRSSVKTPVRLTIHPNPMGNDGQLTVCDDDDDGLASFVLSQAHPQIFTGAGATFAYFLTLDDAQNGNSPQAVNFTNTIPGGQDIYVQITDQNGCRDIVILTLEVLPLPQVQLTITHETCAGDSDGSIDITFSGSSLEVSLDQNVWTTVDQFSDLSAGNYTLWVRDENMCSRSYDFTIEEGLILTIGSFQSVCNNNGTDTDPGDDVYTVNFTINHNQGNSGQFTLSDGTNSLGNFNYGEAQMITIPAMSQSLTLTFTDIATGCLVTRNIGPLNPCSTNCLITAETFEYTCNNNGTDTDGSDDYYTVTLSATAVNGSATNTYNVWVNGILLYNFIYGESSTFQINAGGNIAEILLEDNEDANCTLLLQTDVLAPCSDNCVVNAMASNYVCNDNGTPSDNSDDIFFFDLNVSGINTSGMWQVTGSGISGIIPSTTTLGPYNLSDGNFTLLVEDMGDANCSSTVSIVAPAPCSEPCILEVTGLSTTPCDNNGTGNTDEDDVFTVTFTVNNLAGNTGDYTVTLGAMNWGPFIYGEEVTISDLPADGSLLQLNIQGVSDPSCATIIEIAEDPCSSCSQTVDLGGDQTITCEVNSVMVSANASEPAEFLWSGPGSFSSTSMTVSLSTAGTYTVTATFADQCEATDDIVIGIDANVPMVNGGPDGLLTCDELSLVLDGSQSSAGTDIIYSWFDANNQLIGTDVQLPVDQPGSYFLMVSDTASMCSSGLDEVVVNIDTLPPQALIFAQPDNIVNCVILTVTLFTETGINEIYTWFFPNKLSFPGSQVTVDEAGEYQLYAIDTISGCENSNTIIIEDLTQYPGLDVEEPGQLDCDNTSVLLNASGSQQGDDLILNWFDEDGIQIGQDYSLEVMSPGVYYAELIDTANGCLARDTLIVEDIGDYPEIDAGENLQLPCGETTTSLSGLIEGETGGLDIQWTSPLGNIISGSGSLTPQVEGQGTYYFTVADPLSGCESIDSVSVLLVEDIPEVLNMQVDSISCFGQLDGAIQLFEVLGGSEPYTILLNGNNVSGQLLFENLGPGTYQFQLTDGNGCTLDTIITLPAPVPITIDLDPVITLLYNETSILEAVTNLTPEQIREILWTPGDNLSCDSCLVTEITAIQEGEYLLTITDRNGCMETASISLLIREVNNLFVPNVFSPNDDGVNDFFTIYGGDNLVRIMNLTIYDRWGEVVYSAQDIEPNIEELGWNGKLKGQSLNPAVFVYKAEVLFRDEKLELISGDVTLVR